MPPPDPFIFSSIPTCLTSLKRGSFLIVLDSPARENEGDLLILASALTSAKCAFMVRHTSGYLCAPLTSRRAEALGLRMMVAQGENGDPNGTAYSVSVDAMPASSRRVSSAGESGGKEGGVTTGISAQDRSATARVLAAPWATKSDLRRPGHVLPLVAREGGVRERRGHTEAAVEFARLCGLEQGERVGVIGELVDEVDEDEDEEESEDEEDGTDEDDNHEFPRKTQIYGYNGVMERMDHERQVNKRRRVERRQRKLARRKPEYENATGMMRAEACLRFGRKWGIDVCTIEDLVRYVEEEEKAGGRVGNENKVEETKDVR